MPHPGLHHTYSKWQRNQRVRDAVAKAAPGEVRLREINAGFGIQSAATTIATMVPVMLPPTMLQPPGTLVQPVVGVIVGGTMVGETKIDLATGGKNCSLAKLLADLFSPKPQPTTKKKTLTSALPCSSRPYAAAGQIAITRWRTPTKLTGDPNLPLHNTPSEAICAICITFHEMSIPPHCSKFIDFSIIIVASSSIGAGDDHETDAGWFGGRTDSNCFFVTRKKSNAAPFKQ